jgi:hypothetical protein
MVLQNVLTALSSRANDQASPAEQLLFGVVMVVAGSIFFLRRRRLWPGMRWSSRAQRLDADVWGEGRGLYLLSYVVLPCIFVVGGAYMIGDVIRG